MSEVKDTNPKDGIGATKVPLSMIPGVALSYQALVHLAGSLKYGKWNWRRAGVRASIYLDAIGRHAMKMNEGEWLDEETGLPHAAAICASCNILMDAYYSGKLIDDRPPLHRPAFDLSVLDAEVKRLRAIYAEYTPKHYTIED